MSKKGKVKVVPTVEDQEAAADAYLSTVKREHLKCRLIGHCWDFVYDDKWFIVVGKGASKRLVQPLKCERCESFGENEFDPVTRQPVGGRSYDMADGYKSEGAGRTLSRQYIREYMAKPKTRGKSRLRVVS